MGVKISSKLDDLMLGMLLNLFLSLVESEAVLTAFSLSFSALETHDSPSLLCLAMDRKKIVEIQKFSQFSLNTNMQKEKEREPDKEPFSSRATEREINYLIKAR